MTGAREMRTLAPGWKSLDDLVCWVHTLLPEREERERPEEVRGMHFSCLLPPETRRPSGPKEEEVRLPLLASMVVGVGCRLLLCSRGLFGAFRLPLFLLFPLNAHEFNNK